MDSTFLPDSLPQVTYFLMEFNTPGWFVLFRVLLGVVFVLSAVLFFYYHKNNPEIEEDTKNKKKDGR